MSSSATTLSLWTCPRLFGRRSQVRLAAWPLPWLHACTAFLIHSATLCVRSVASPEARRQGGRRRHHGPPPARVPPSAGRRAAGAGGRGAPARNSHRICAFLAACRHADGRRPNATQVLSYGHLTLYDTSLQTWLPYFQARPLRLAAFRAAFSMLTSAHCRLLVWGSSTPHPLAWASSPPAARPPPAPAVARRRESRTGL